MIAVPLIILLIIYRCKRDRSVKLLTLNSPVLELKAQFAYMNLVFQTIATQIKLPRQ